MNTDDRLQAVEDNLRETQRQLWWVQLTLCLVGAAMTVSAVAHFLT